MENIRIEVEGLAEMQKHVNAGIKSAEKTYRSAMTKATSTVRTKARKNLYKGHGLKTGTLRRSIFTKVEPLKGIIGVSEKYGPYVEFGTKPHTILPRGKALRFKTKEGKWVFAKSVRHPGNREIPFMRPAAKDSVSDITQIFKEAIQIVTRRMAKG